MSEVKACSRCHKTFECCADNIQSCHCQQIALTEHQRKEIAKQYSSCLCHACLLLLANESNT